MVIKNPNTAKLVGCSKSGAYTGTFTNIEQGILENMNKRQPMTQESNTRHQEKKEKDIRKHIFKKQKENDNKELKLMKLKTFNRTDE